MTRIILVLAVVFLVIFAVRLVKLLMNFSSSSSKPNIDDLKSRAANLKNKYKDLEEADFRDITPPEDESEPPKEDDVK